MRREAVDDPGEASGIEAQHHAIGGKRTLAVAARLQRIAEIMMGLDLRRCGTGVAGQDEAGCLWDVLYLLLRTIRRADGRQPCATAIYKPVAMRKSFPGRGLKLAS